MPQEHMPHVVIDLRASTLEEMYNDPPKTFGVNRHTSRRGL